MCGSANPLTGGMVIVSGVVSSESIGGNVVPIVMIRDSGEISPL
jgi:hypothetical protein